MESPLDIFGYLLQFCINDSMEEKKYFIEGIASLLLGFACSIVTFSLLSHFLLFT